MALPSMTGVRFVFAPPPEAAWLHDGTLDGFWRAAEALLRQVHEVFGADRLMWGSNYPAVSKVCSYRQTIDFIREGCAFLSDSDRAKILGGTAQRIFDLKWN